MILIFNDLLFFGAAIQEGGLVRKFYSWDWLIGQIGY